MKVIKKGKLKVNITCKNCFAELEIEPSDVIVYRCLGHVMERTEDKYYVECPECKNRIYLSNMKEIPQVFFKNATEE